MPNSVPYRHRLIASPRFARALGEFARLHPGREVGGILIGRRGYGVTATAAAAFPPQFASCPVMCAFESSTLATLCDALEDPGLQPVGWVHTHPRLGLFLSEVDLRTFRAWLALDPLAVAVVVDPFRWPRRTIEAWNGRLESIEIEAENAQDLDAQPARRLAQRLAHAAPAGDPWQVVCGEGAFQPAPAHVARQSPAHAPLLARPGLFAAGRRIAFPPDA